MKKKKILACALLAIIALAMAAPEAYARWSLMQAINQQMTFSSNKANTVVAVFGMPGVTSIKAEFWLCERNADGSYYKIHSWPEKRVSGRILYFTGTAPATPGKTYRLYTKATASDTSGVSETVLEYVQSTY